eukprot:g9039.t1
MYLVIRAPINFKAAVRDLESKGVEVVTIQSGRHISVLAAESDVAVDVPSKVPFTPTRHSSSFLSSFSTPSPRSGDALQPHLACISPKPFDISTHPALKCVYCSRRKCPSSSFTTSGGIFPFSTRPASVFTFNLGNTYTTSSTSIHACSPLLPNVSSNFQILSFCLVFTFTAG